MERTHLPLPTWFMAIYLIATSSKGVSAMVISRQLGISYKTAWILCHRIRQLLADDDSTLRGIVEVDETYIGGKRRRDAKSKRDSDDDQPKGRGGSRKMMAVTAVERDGKAKARKGRTHSERTIAGAVFDRYLRELAVRWNMRRMSRMERFDLVLGSMFARPLSWRALSA